MEAGHAVRVCVDNRPKNGVSERRQVCPTSDILGNSVEQFVLPKRTIGKRSNHAIYPAGMDLLWDPITKLVTVIFNDKPAALLGPFKDRSQGIAAGEKHCRGLGWKPNDHTFE